MDQGELSRQVARLETLLADRCAARRGTLRQRVARVGRGLPLTVRRDLARVAEAADLAGHPKLALRMDGTAVAAAAARAEAHLKHVDPRDRRRGRLLGLLAALAVNLGLASAVLLTVLIWRGFL